MNVHTQTSTEVQIRLHETVRKKRTRRCPVQNRAELLELGESYMGMGQNPGTVREPQNSW